MANAYKTIAGAIDGSDRDGLNEAIKSTSQALHVTGAADYQQISANTLVKTVTPNTPAIFMGVEVIAPGTLGTVRVFDGINNTGTQLIPTTASLVLGLYVGGGGAGMGIRCKTGIYVEVTNGAVVNVLYL